MFALLGFIILCKQAMTSRQIKAAVYFFQSRRQLFQYFGRCLQPAGGLVEMCLANQLAILY